MERTEAPPEIVSLTGDSHIRNGESVYDPAEIHAHVAGGDVTVWFENQLYDHPEYGVYEVVESDSVADALREMADMVESVAHD